MYSELQEKNIGLCQSLCKGSTNESELDPEDVQRTFKVKYLEGDDVESTDNPECSTSRTTVHDLPPELLIDIFSWFSVKELCLTISPVCKTWHLNSRHPSLWKHLSFEGQSVTTERLCLLLSNATQLQSLRLVDRVDTDALLEQVALSNQRLHILKVKSCVGSNLQPQIQEDILINLIKSCSKLVEITIKRSQFCSDELLKVVGLVLPDLKRINFNDNQYLGSRPLNTIVSYSKPLEEVCVFWPSHIREIIPNINEYDINDNDIIKLCTRMKNSLKILKICARELTDNSMISISQCTCLHTLHIIYCKDLSDIGILQLTALRNLSSLDIWYNCRVSSEGWQKLFIRSNGSSLRKLSLIACSAVDDKVLESIGGNCPNLQRICLTACYLFTEKGMSNIIKGCPQLIFLRVDSTSMNIMRSFPLIPNYTPNLRYIVFEFFGSSLWLEEAIRILYDLILKLPNLEIHPGILL